MDENEPSSSLANLSGKVMASSSVGLYVHVPFCQRKCPYCDFNTYAGLEPLYAKTVDALCAELSRWEEPLRTRKLSTIFFGGGTPTALSIELLGRLMNAIRESFTLADDCEITSEANPGAVDSDKFDELRRLGFNRLSMGVQSFQPNELAFLERIHSVDDVERSFQLARQAGFANINLDFIFGLPGQSSQSWQYTLEQALALEPEHLSLYSLIVEPDTPLFHWVETGRVDPPDEDVAAELFEASIETLAAAGFVHYEVSNWAKTPELACRHNLTYWRNGEYLGVGPGAHSHLRLQSGVGSIVDRRWGNRKAVAGYVKRIQDGSAIEEFVEELTPELAMGETMMLGLRLLQEGVPYHRFAELHGVDLRQAFDAELQSLHEVGLLEADPTGVRLSRSGLMFGNQVFAHFLPSEMMVQPA